MQGRIASWKPERGFGFLNPDGNGDDIFFTSLASSIDRVSR